MPAEQGRDTTAVTNHFLTKMSSGYEVVDEVRCGDQEHNKELIASEWKTIRAVYPNFAQLPSERGDCTWSPVLKCHGLEWTVGLYPGGHKNSINLSEVGFVLPT